MVVRYDHILIYNHHDIIRKTCYDGQAKRMTATEMSQHWNAQRIDEAYLNITSTTIDEENELFVYLLSQNCVGCPFKYYPVEQVSFFVLKGDSVEEPFCQYFKASGVVNKSNLLVNKTLEY